MDYVIECSIATLMGDSAWIIDASRQVARWLPNDAEANADALFQVGIVHYYAGDLNQADAYVQKLEI